jgi:hypothetical protein
MRQRLEAALHERVVRPPLYPLGAPEPYLRSPAARAGAVEAKGGARGGGEDDTDDEDEVDGTHNPDMLSATQRQLLERVLSASAGGGASSRREVETPPKARRARHSRAPRSAVWEPHVCYVCARVRVCVYAGTARAVQLGC